jgi:general secretion pathway protein D
MQQPVPDPAAAASAQSGVIDPWEPPARQGRRDRRPTDPEERSVFAVNARSVKDLIPLIVSWTGKPVIPKADTLETKKVTILNDRPVTRVEALELIYQALRLNGVGIVETDSLIMIDDLAQVNKLLPSVVLGPEVNVLDLLENGQYVIKIFQLKHARASSIEQLISTSKPDYAQISTDSSSNQIVVESDVGYAKRVQEVVNLVDVPPYEDTITETFRLRFADATLIADAINVVFAPNAASGGAGRGAQPRQGNRAGQNPQPINPGGAAAGGDAPTLTTQVLAATNSITVRTTREIMDGIRSMVVEWWDVPPDRDGSIFKSYDLKYTDPLKVKELLDALLGSGSGTVRTGGQRNNARNLAIPGGGGEAGGATAATQGVFTIEAYPDSNRLVVVSKAPDNFVWLDALLSKIDTPLEAGMPENIPLKYASAVDVAQLINILLAESGTGGSLAAPEEGLNADFTSTQGGDVGTTPGVTNTSGGSTGSSPREIEFPWQGGGGARGGNQDQQSEVSALIGKSRVVPVAEQNALLVLAPPEIKGQIKELITNLDTPGRQVMIAAILAEVELGDQFAMGIQFGPAGTIAPLNPNNAIVIGTQAEGDRLRFTGAKDNIFPSVLNVSNFNFGVSATVILQALQRDTSVRILQQPRVFTTENEEAVFFAGQDVPFLTGTTTGGATGGGTTSSFDQISVGIGVNVRPRITQDRNVAMEVNILLSNINTTSSLNVGGSNNPVIDRRQTQTRVTVKDKQTIVLSGVRRESENFEKTGFPVLGQIPILDLFFSNKDENKSVAELLVFITPTVVINPDENDSNFNADDRERLEIFSKPLNATSQGLVERNNLNLPERSGEQPIDPIAPIDPSVGP